MAIKHVKPPSIPPTPKEGPDPNTLGGKVWYTLRDGFSEALKLATHPFAIAIQWGIELILDLMRREAKEAAGDLINTIRQDPDTPIEIKRILDYIMEEEGELSGFLLSSVGGTAVGGTIGSFIPALTANLTAKGHTIAQGVRLDPTTAIYSHYRGYLNNEELHKELTEVGLTAWRRVMMTQMNRPILSPQDAITLWLRNVFTDSDIDSHLAGLGYEIDVIGQVKKLAEQLPGPGDLISMAVREAWRDDIASAWGTDQDYPVEFGRAMEKQGFDVEWSRRYWRAHWQLPGLVQGFEMFHRGELTREELMGLMQAQDIMPGYREKLLNIAYSPYTRVDVRRMYGLGILNEDEVFTAYLDIGYEPEKAANMTEFTILYETGADRDLAKGEILDGYKRGLIAEDKAKQTLGALGYSPENVNFYLARENLKLSQARKEAKLKSIKQNYVQGIYTYSEADARLGMLGLPSGEEQRLFDLWDIERERRLARPTVGQYLNFFSNSVISENEFKDELDKKGYLPNYILWFVDNLEKVKAEKLIKEEEAEQKKLLSLIKVPSKAELRVFWTEGLITELDFRDRMGLSGYGKTDIQVYVDYIEKIEEERLAKEELAELEKRLKAIKYPSKTDLKAFFLVDLIDIGQYEAELLRQGFKEDWVAKYVALVEGKKTEEEIE